MVQQYPGLTSAVYAVPFHPEYLEDNAEGVQFPTALEGHDFPDYK